MESLQNISDVQEKRNLLQKVVDFFFSLNGLTVIAGFIWVCSKFLNLYLGSHLLFTGYINKIAIVYWLFGVITISLMICILYKDLKMKFKEKKGWFIQLVLISLILIMSFFFYLASKDLYNGLSAMNFMGWWV